MFKKSNKQCYQNRGGTIPNIVLTNMVASITELKNNRDGE